MRVSWVIGFALLYPLCCARADCEDGVAALTAQMASVADLHTREVLMADLRQAQLDLWEFDEVECAAALSHAARFLHRQADTAAIPNPVQPGAPTARHSP